MPTGPRKRPSRQEEADEEKEECAPMNGLDFALQPDVPIGPGHPIPDFNDPNVMARIMRQNARERWKRGEYQIRALLAAKWLPDPVYDDLEPWQWAWRRPPRRPGSNGMRFASTNQAYNALMRSR